MNSKPEPITVLIAIVLSLQALGAGLTSIGAAVPDPAAQTALTVASVVMDVVTAAALVGIGVIVRGLVTPNRDVAEYRNTAGLLIAGPANELPTGSVVRAAGSLDITSPVSRTISDLAPVNDGVDYRAGDPETGQVDDHLVDEDVQPDPADDQDELGTAPRREA